MLLKLKTLFAICLTAVGTQAAAGALEEVTDYGPNPTGVKMYVYKPEKLANPPPLIVGIHWCHGSAEAYYNGTLFANLADTHGFIVIYPDAPDQVDHCWDVNTNATLTHNGGGDSLGIASQVRYAIKHYGVDRKRIFATGVSSGAMMTNVVCGSYPDLFKAGSASSGVPFGCFAGPDAWNTECATGEVIKTPQQWGNLVRDAYPGYRGPRPKFQFWHGTNDTTLYPQNFKEEIKQWTNVFGVSERPTSVQIDSPLPGYTRSSYGPNVQAILAKDVGHNIPNSPEQADSVLAWFGLKTAADET